MHVSRAPGRRAVVLAAAALLVVAGVIGLLLLLRGGDEHSPRRPAAPTGIEPLAFMPADADVVLDLDTGAPTVALAAAALVPRLPGATLSGEQLRPLLGSRMAIALDGGRMWLAAITQAPPPPVRGAAKRGGTVVVGPSVPAPRPGARAEFDRRFTGLPASNARVAFDAAALLAARRPDFAATAWGRSLRGGAAVLELRGDRVVLPFQVAADPAGVKPSDLPVVPGPVTPVMRGSGPIVGGVRSPTQTLAFLRSAGLLPALDVLDRAPGFLRPNLSDLGPEATITTPDGRVFTVRTTPPNPGDWAAKLGRLDALAGLIRFTGIANVRIDRQADGAYTIEQDGKLAGRVGVYGPVVVFSTDARANLAAAARAPVTPAPPGAAGALTLRLAPALLGVVLPALARDHLGDVTGWARFAPAGVRGELGVAVR
jgi:hypothetical protein